MGAVMRWIIAGICLVLAGNGPAHALDGPSVQRLMAEGHAAEARQLAVQAAGEGDWRAAHFASWAMLEGIGGPVERDRALVLAEQAAASGDWIARYDQAKALSENPETLAQARILFAALAEEGYSPAMLRMADNTDLEEAARLAWIDKAAALGHPTAIAVLAARQNDAQEAERLYRRAVLTGHLASALTLAELHRAEPAEALPWLMLASARLIQGARYYGERVDQDRLVAQVEAITPMPDPTLVQPRVNALLAAYGLAPWPCNIECEPWRPEIW